MTAFDMRKSTEWFEGLYQLEKQSTVIKVSEWRLAVIQTL